MTVANLLILLLTLLIIGLIFDWIHYYSYQKKYDKLKKENEELEILHQGLNKLLSINDQIHNERDDEKRLALRYYAIETIKQLIPIAQKLEQTSIVILLESQLNDQCKYTKTLEIIKELDLNPNLNYNKGE